MSSITASDRSRKTDEVRNAREEYEQREAENAKKTKKQIVRLEKQHNANLNKIKEKYDEQVDEIRQKSRETLTKRDENHLQQVEKVRNVYQEQLKKKAEDSEQQRRALNEAKNSDAEKREKITNQQVEALTRAQRDELLERDRQFTDFSERSRQQLRESLAERTAKLQKKHDQELDLAVGERNNTAADRERKLSEQRSEYNNLVKQQDRRHRTEMDRTNAHWREVVRNSEDTANAIIDNRSEMLKAERENMKSRYENKMAEKVDQMDRMRNALNDNVEDRYNGQLRAAKNQTLRAKAKNIQDNLTNDRRMKLERDHIVQQYEARMLDLQRQQSGIRDAAKDLVHSRVTQAVEKNDRILQETNRRHRLDQDLNAVRNKEDRALLQEQTQSQLMDTRKRADNQVRNIMKASRKEQVIQESHHTQNLGQLKNNYSEQLSAQRNAHIAGLSEIRTEMEQRLREQEAKAQKRHEYLVESYETKMKQMQESHKAELDQLRKGFIERQQSQEAAHRMGAQQLDQKYQIKINAQEEEHQRQLERQQKRHEEKLADVAGKVAYYKKKA